MDKLDKIDIIFICLISFYLLVLFITICVLLHQNDIRKEKDRTRRYKVIKVVHPKKKRGRPKKKKTEDNVSKEKKTTTKKTTTKKKTTTTKKKSK